MAAPVLFGLACLLACASVEGTGGEAWTGFQMKNSGVVPMGNLGDATARVRQLIQDRKTSQEKLYTEQDAWKMELDHNTLLSYEKRDLIGKHAAMKYSQMYYNQLYYRTWNRNEQLHAENTALNATVQNFEQLIKNYKQRHFWWSRDTEALDQQNKDLMKEVGAIHNGNTGNGDSQSGGPGARTFGLTKHRQDSVHRKLLNDAYYKAVDTLALAMRADKEKYINHAVEARVLKNNAVVDNTGIESHVVTLTAQRNYELTRKLIETHKKKNEDKRRAQYLAEANALDAKQRLLEAELKKLVMQNERLRELQKEHEEERIDRKKDRDMQKWQYVEALLQRNAAVTYRDKMIAGYTQERATRDAWLKRLSESADRQATYEVSLTDCEEENRHLEQHKMQLTQRNAFLRKNCQHTHNF